MLIYQSDPSLNLLEGTTYTAPQSKEFYCATHSYTLDPHPTLLRPKTARERSSHLLVVL